LNASQHKSRFQPSHRETPKNPPLQKPQGWATRARKFKGWRARQRQRLVKFSRHIRNVRGVNLKIWVMSFLFASFVSCTAFAQDPAPQVASAHKGRKQALLITLEVPNTTVKVGLSIGAKMVMTNISRKPFDVGFGSESLTEMERCLRSNGPCNTSSNPWGPCPAEDKECGALVSLPLRGGPSGILLAPGKSVSGPAEINPHVYDLTRPGKYTLQWQVRYSSDVVFKSNTVTVTIIP
jgi:hypothetical protein